LYNTSSTSRLIPFSTSSTKGVENWNFEESMVPRAKSLTRSVTWFIRICIKKEKLRLILKFIKSKARRHAKWKVHGTWILTTHLGAWVNNKPLHVNLHLVVFQEGTNLLQHSQINYMHDNDDPFVKQKPICKKYNGFDKIIHLPILKRNEGKGLRDVWNQEIRWYICNNKVNLVFRKNLKNKII